MRNILTIAVREFSHNIRRPSFLFSLFGTPLIVVGVMIVSILLSDGESGSLDEYKPVGIVDNSAQQVLAEPVPSDKYPADLFVPYATGDEADAAARAGEISAYYELPANYMDTGRVTLYTMRSAPSDLNAAFNAMIRSTLSVGIENTTALDVLIERPDLSVTVQEGNRTFSQNGAFFVMFLPIIFGFLLIMSSVTATSFLMSGLVEEKTNRIIEVLITTVRPMELLVGKMLGMGVLGLLQVVVLVVGGLIGLAVAEQNQLISGVTLPPELIIMALVYYLLSYFLLAAVSISIGAIAGTEQEARQYSAFITLPVMLPYMFLVSFMLDANGTVPTIMSLIPITAPMAILMRMGMTVVPAWQIILSVITLIVVNLLVLWAASRLFRWGVLNSSKMPGPRRLLQVLRGRIPESPKPPTQPEAI